MGLGEQGSKTAVLSECISRGYTAHESEQLKSDPTDDFVAWL